MVLAPASRWIARPSAGLSLNQAPVRAFCDAVDDLADVVEPHRRAVAIGDDDVAKAGGVEELVVGVEGDGLVRALEVALRPVDASPAASALRTSSRPMPRAASAPGLTWTCTA